MRVAIISDSHDNEPNILKALKYIAELKVKTIVHCGDICNPESLELFAKNFAGEIYLVYGNGDFEQKDLKKIAADHHNVHLLGEVGEVTLGDKKIAFNHYPTKARTLAQTGKYDLVFYGHTHTPWEEMENKTKLLNPGTLAGLRNKATFAIYDTATDKATLTLLEKI